MIETHYNVKIIKYQWIKISYAVGDLNLQVKMGDTNLKIWKMWENGSFRKVA